MDSPVFIVSLDFELLWGVFDKIGKKVDDAYFKKTRVLIPRMLEIFAKHKIEVTWATVGMLFAENEEEWNQYNPKYLPSFREKEHSAYHWVKQNGLNPVYHFAPELIQMIHNTPGQEIGSHTYAHYYTLLRGQTPEQFKHDLQAAQSIAKDKFDIQLKSLVFPRNHVNLLYLDICADMGFEQVRTNPEPWYWQEAQHEGFLKKVFRTADCYVPFGPSTAYNAVDVFHWENRIWMMPASRLLKHYAPNNFLSNSVRLQRVKDEMKLAAKNKQVYHLWWHPHNFAHDPDGALKELDTLLVFFDELRSQYGMESNSMSTFGEKLKLGSKNLKVAK